MAIVIHQFERPDRTNSGTTVQKWQKLHLNNVLKQRQREKNTASRIPSSSSLSHELENHHLEHSRKETVEKLGW